MQVLGLPFDCGKFHTQASHFSGCCALWRGNNNFSTKIAIKQLAVLRFTVFVKNQGVCIYSSCIYHTNTEQTAIGVHYHLHGFGILVFDIQTPSCTITWPQWDHWQLATVLSTSATTSGITPWPTCPPSLSTYQWVYNTWWLFAHTYYSTYT